MSLTEIESAITNLPRAERIKLSEWLAELEDDEWDRQIEADVKAGKLDAMINQAKAQFEAGNCTPI